MTYATILSDLQARRAGKVVQLAINIAVELDKLGRKVKSLDKKQQKMAKVSEAKALLPEWQALMPQLDKLKRAIEADKNNYDPNFDSGKDALFETAQMQRTVKDNAESCQEAIKNKKVEMKQDWQERARQLSAQRVGRVVQLAEDDEDPPMPQAEVDAILKTYKELSKEKEKVRSEFDTMAEATNKSKKPDAARAKAWLKMYAAWLPKIAELQKKITPEFKRASKKAGEVDSFLRNAARIYEPARATAEKWAGGKFVEWSEKS